MLDFLMGTGDGGVYTHVGLRRSEWETEVDYVLEEGAVQEVLAVGRNRQ